MRGIARTMELKTIIDAMLDSHYKLIHHWNEQGHDKRYRQHDAFRARVVRMDAIGRAINADLNTEIEMMGIRIAELDVKVEKLLEMAKMLDSHRKTLLNNEYLDAMSMARMIMQRESK